MKAKEIRESLGLNRKFKDTVRAREFKIEAELSAMFINMNMESAKQLFDVVFTEEFLKLLAEEDIYTLREYVRKKVESSDSYIPIPNRGQGETLIQDRKASLYAPQQKLRGYEAEDFIFDAVIPQSSCGVYYLMTPDTEKHELILRPDVDSILGINDGGDNMKVSFDEQGYNVALKELEALISESKKAAKCFTELGVTVSNAFLLKAMRGRANRIFYELLKDKIEEYQGGFGFAGESVYPNFDLQRATNDTASKYRLIYTFLVYLSGNHRALLETHLTPTYLKVAEDNSLQFAPGALEQLARDYSTWTHGLRGNKIAKNLDEYKKMRKKIEADGLSISDFEAVTSEYTDTRAKILFCSD